LCEAISKKGLHAMPTKHHDRKKAESHRGRSLDYGSWLLARVLVGVVVLIVVSTFAVHHFMQVYEGRPITYGQATLFVVQTVTTTGYGELLPFVSSPMKILAVVLMLLGVTMIFMFGSTLMAILIERRLARPVPTSTTLSRHVIFTAHDEAIERIIALLRRHQIP